ncbi:histidinol-phosphatase [Thermasporomyces composti]|jgi:histidinol-phosphatase|uniref:Histidinol-phosphatase n=1 Tax=Thermasporomyces composti TaxID=696763 RepID=A0A3D9V138_THECX|nr:histidinol-phosphatase [Thermasporomyces composti]REF35488.1 histidinol-phosphate phosphatase [Thermasporomyces composti]
MASTHTDDLRLAHLLADDADSLTTSRFRAADLRVSTKRDESPVSDADTAVEEAVRRTLSRARPRDSIEGEELGKSGWGPRRWIIDPIDGTKNYVRGVPVWATLIALAIEEEIVVGVVSAPQLGRRWWASRGDGAFAGRSIRSAQPCRVSSVDSVSSAFLSYSSPDGWVKTGRGKGFGRLLEACGRTRGFGDFWSYMLLAEGLVDIATEPELNLHDMAALSVIVEEAGGRFTDLDGKPGPYGGNALATNGLLHDEVLEILSSQ